MSDLEVSPCGVGAERAGQRIAAFEKRFGTAHLHLARHAAFPLALTPELLSYLWVNFQRDVHGQPLNIPWVAVADVLLSGLCVEIGSELYEMHAAIRSALLRDLQADLRFGWQRIDELSTFLLSYVRQQIRSDDPDVRDVAQAQRWTALAYIRPERAARELALALKQSIVGADIAQQLRLAAVVDTLAEPLVDFQPLLVYTRRRRDIIRGVAPADAAPTAEVAQEVQVAGISLPTLLTRPAVAEQPVDAPLGPIAAAAPSVEAIPEVSHEEPELPEVALDSTLQEHATEIVEPFGPEEEDLLQKTPLYVGSDRFIATPTLMIGLGGTGLKIATFVKKSLLEANGNVLPQRMAFLVLDTEREIKFKLGGWGRERDPYQSIGPVRIGRGEYLPLTGNIRQIGNAIKQEQLDAIADPSIRNSQPLRHISSWFQAGYYIDELGVDSSVWNLDVGTGRLRQYGRLALFNKFSHLVSLLQSNLYSIRQAGANQIYVHIAGSLAGGTGAALCIDIAHLVTQCARAAGFLQTPIVIGHFVLPEGFRGTPEVQLANVNTRADFDLRCFAALRELTRLCGITPASTGGYPLVYRPDGYGPENAKLENSLYTNVYLYDGLRPNNPLDIHRIEDGLAPSIADTIMAYIDNRSSPAFYAHSINRRAFYSSFGIPEGNMTYGTIGTYTIELPIYHIVEGWSHTLARQVLDTLLAPRQRDPASAVPAWLTPDQPGGKRADPFKAAEEWLRVTNTALVAQLAEWGRVAQSAGLMRQEAINAMLQLDAGGWWLRLAPTTIDFQPYVTEAQIELDGSLKLNRPTNMYYVDFNPVGNNAAQRISNLQLEIDEKLTRMVGREESVWQREGGQFGKALTRLANYHRMTFEMALLTWLKEMLNGDPNFSDAIERKQGKLGYAQAFLDHVNMMLKSSSRVLAEAQAQAGRKPIFDRLQSERTVAANEMQRAGLFGEGRSRKAYRDKSDELAQFHKADIARKVVAGLVEGLQVTVEQAIKEVEQWVRALATAAAVDGGAYALLLDGQREVAIDRESARNAARWVIRDDEPGDIYIQEKYKKYVRYQPEELLRSITWTVGRADSNGLIQINFTLDGEAWMRRAGAGGQRAMGARNLATLLDRCRTVFQPAWNEMSVSEYLSHNYENNVAALAQHVKNASSFPLAPASWDGKPTMRTTFMRVFKENLNQKDIQFLTNLRTEVAKEFKETYQLAAKLAVEQQGATVSGEDSRDRFKLTFLMFGDLMRPEEIAAFAQARENYRMFSSRNNQWKQLHVLPAETNALQIERQLSSGSVPTRQRRRELDERVVTALEDIQSFRLAMRCLVYGDAYYDWKIGEERGVLLHKYYPPRAENPNGWSYWRLTVVPQSERQADGRFYTPFGLAMPEHYQLSDLALEPDLLEALIQFVCLGRDRRTGTPINFRRVDATVQLMMDQHAREWSSHPEMGWIPKDRVARDAKLREEAHDKAAQIIRLNAYIASIDANMESFRWAWMEGGTDPVVDEIGAPYTAQRLTEIKKFVDLLTALGSVAREEMEGLEGRFRELGVWKNAIPREYVRIASDVALQDERSALRLDDAASTTGESWVCSKGHRNSAQANFCEYCDGLIPRPEPELAVPPSTPPLVTRPEVKSPVRVCLNGHELLPDVSFCPKCGAPELPPAPLPTMRVCLNGHELPPDAVFCPRCGKPARA